MRSLIRLALILLYWNLLPSLVEIPTTIRVFVAAESSSPSNINNRNMGNTVKQISRAASYSIAKNEQSAISVLEFHGKPLNWFRLDDGIMGGRSETVHVAHNGELHFNGTINTDGGGFTSIRSKLPEGLLTTDTHGLKIRYRGDGKTYKVILSTGDRGGPFSRVPSWQCDLPTTVPDSVDQWNEADIPFQRLRASFGGGPGSQPSQEEREQYRFDPLEMKEIGLMLSLKLSDGSPNPPETFGAGVFPFSLVVQSITTY